MSMKDYSAELLKMEGVQIEKLDETEKEIILQISMERKMHICKRCGGKTGRIHDYRVREVRDLELRGKPVRLLYRRRRYVRPAASAFQRRTALSGATCALPIAPQKKSCNCCAGAAA